MAREVPTRMQRIQSFVQAELGDGYKVDRCEGGLWVRYDPPVINEDGKMLTCAFAVSDGLSDDGAALRYITMTARSVLANELEAHRQREGNGG